VARLLVGEDSEEERCPWWIPDLEFHRGLFSENVISVDFSSLPFYFVELGFRSSLSTSYGAPKFFTFVVV